MVVCLIFIIVFGGIGFLCYLAWNFQQNHELKLARIKYGNNYERQGEYCSNCGRYVGNYGGCLYCGRGGA